MTLTEIATQVVNLHGQTDANSLALAKTIVKNKYEQIWNGSLWKDSVSVVTQTYTSGTTPLTVDSSLSTVLKVRWNNFPLQLITYDDLMDIYGTNLLTSTADSPKYFLPLPLDSNRNPVIQILGNPTTTQTVVIYGKLKFTQLTDTTSPTINGIDQALVEFASAYFLRRMNQYAKADNMEKQSANTVQALIDIENNQQADNHQVRPIVDDWNYAGDLMSNVMETKSYQ